MFRPGYKAIFTLGLLLTMSKIENDIFNLWYSVISPLPEFMKNVPGIFTKIGLSKHLKQ